MRNVVKLGSSGLLVLGIWVLTPPVQAAKKFNTEDQVAVLLKWYQNYFEQGKYKQAEQVAQLAYELAPDDPQIAVALKLARRQQANGVSPTAEVEAQLAKVLQKLDRVERQLRDTAAKNRRRAILQIAKEPPGSPDAN
jgi:tetratricopeptide (TPR) repeat protein